MSSFGAVRLEDLSPRAQAKARELLAARANVTRASGVTTVVHRADDVALVEVFAPPVLCVTLPWDDLVSDNAKYGPAPNGRLWLTREYRKAKKVCAEKAKLQVAGLSPMPGRVRIDVRMYEPDRKKTRDISNYSKLLHDALRGVCYLDDGQIDVTHYERGPVDATRPRVEVMVKAL